MRRYLSSLLLGAALCAPVVMYAQDEHHDKRYYDREKKDYHEWNEREERAYRHWLKEERHHEYRGAGDTNIWTGTDRWLPLLRQDKGSPQPSKAAARGERVPSLANGRQPRRSGVWAWLSTHLRIGPLGPTRPAGFKHHAPPSECRDLTGDGSAVAVDPILLVDL